MESIEIQAEIFRVVRANMDKPKTQIKALIFEHLPDVPKEYIIEALKKLSRE